MTNLVATYILRLTLVVAMTIATLSCDSGTLWEDEKYEVYWIDSVDNIELGIKLGGGGYQGRGRPIAVGSDDKYLVVQKELGYFYVVKLQDDWRKDFNPGQHGPYTLEQFNALKQELHLPEFEKRF